MTASAQIIDLAVRRAARDHQHGLYCERCPHRGTDVAWAPLAGRNLCVPCLLRNRAT